jgi:hypothetical protein
MKKLLLAICLCFIFQQSEAQEKQKFDPQFYTLQDSLKSLSYKIVNNKDELIRRNCTFKFIKTFVSALKLPNSFAFPFDSVVSISIMRSPDNQFRIFTWHLRTDDGHYRYYGAIQKNDPNKLSLYPLFDNSAFIQNPQDTALTNDSWYGAHYYTIIVPKRWFSKNKKYVLLGWKGHNQNSQQKVIDVLSFAKDGRPIFGADIIKLKDKTQHRMVFEYTSQAVMMLRYLSDKKWIVYDHLAAPNARSEGNFEVYGPDLSYDGLKYRRGKWILMEKIDLRNEASMEDAKFNNPLEK